MNDVDDNSENIVSYDLASCDHLKIFWSGGVILLPITTFRVIIWFVVAVFFLNIKTVFGVVVREEDSGGDFEGFSGPLCLIRSNLVYEALCKIAVRMAS